MKPLGAIPLHFRPTTLKKANAFVKKHHRHHPAARGCIFVLALHDNVSAGHLPLYLAEFDHKYNTRKISDGARTAVGIRGMEGKRLMLRPAKGSSAKKAKGK